MIQRRHINWSAESPLPRLQLECLEDREMLAADLLMDINQEPFTKSVSGELTTFQGNLAYIARDATNYPSLWFSEGENERDAPAISGFSGSSLTATEDHLFYVSTTRPENAEDFEMLVNVWQSDGSRDGTVLLGSVNAESNPLYRDFIVGQDSLFIVARLNGERIWGMQGWDSELEALIPRQPNNRIGELEVVGSTLFFAFHELGLGEELWTSDGTSAGTRIVKDIRPDRASSFPQQLVAFENRLIMTALDQPHGFELWSSDGT